MYILGVSSAALIPFAISPELTANRREPVPWCPGVRRFNTLTNRRGVNVVYYITINGLALAPGFNKFVDLCDCLAALGIETIPQMNKQGLHIKQVQPGAAAPQPVALS